MPDPNSMSLTESQLRLSRRSLLTGVGAFAAGKASATTSKRGSVVVIGAGMAGLSAASALRGSGHRVVLLEARDRIGGRIHTDRSLGQAYRSISGHRGFTEPERTR